ncbi:M48 family metallopeptidase [Acetobacterium bakii]|uniref:M48 family metallopeptidase n=1 Tax=Acetobacterium bakii TaxID=52689 RepID=UPI0006813782|nr:SprT family zinc-dependent metalloprotease [Acetobacterium bakii]
MTERYIIKYTKRKTLGLYITKDAIIEARVPLGTSKKIIADFVKKHKVWIEEHYAPVKAQVEQREDFTLKFGDQLVFLGKSYPLVAVDEKNTGFNGKCFYAYGLLTPQGIIKEVVRIYRYLAKKVLTHQVEEISHQMNLKPSVVKINGAKSRWGSCSSKGNLNFSWYLVMADEDTMNYVVVHELAHLREMNHSPKFWKIVEGLLPNYKQEKKKLKELQLTLGTQSWE